MEIWKIIDLLDKTITIFLLAGGIVGFLLRSWIAEWIKNKFSKAVSTALQSEKHELDKSLEMYKGNLLKDIEEFKANIDIRRAIALKMADRKLDALTSLLNDTSNYATEAMSMLTMTQAAKLRNHDDYHNALQTLRTTRRTAAIFISLELGLQISTWTGDTAQVVLKCLNDSECLNSNDARYQSISQGIAIISRALRAEIAKPPMQIE